MISEKLQNAINDQINAEMWSSNLYLSMSFYLQSEGFDGFASWMRKQSQEELQHAYDLADYVAKRGGVAKVDKIDVVPQGWGSVLEVLLYAIARHMIVGHEDAVQNLISVAAIALIFIIRRFFFVPSFGQKLPDGKIAPDVAHLYMTESEGSEMGEEGDET